MAETTRSSTMNSDIRWRAHTNMRRPRRSNASLIARRFLLLVVVVAAVATTLVFVPVAAVSDETPPTATTNSVVPTPATTAPTSPTSAPILPTTATPKSRDGSNGEHTDTGGPSSGSRVAHDEDGVIDPSDDAPPPKSAGVSPPQNERKPDKDKKTETPASDKPRSAPETGNAKVVVPPSYTTNSPSTATTTVSTSPSTTTPMTTTPTTTNATANATANADANTTSTPAPPGNASTLIAAVATPYRSTYCRCKDSECQNEYPGEAATGVCVSQQIDGSCPAGFSKCVASNSYKVQVLPSTPNSVADVTFSLLASDIAGALHNLGDQNPMNWWVAFRLPPGWRFVAWASTTVDVELVTNEELHEAATKSVHRQFQVYPCQQVTDRANCRPSEASGDADTVGFVAVNDMVADWSALLSSAVKAPLIFRLEKSIVSGPTTTDASGQVGVFIVYEKTTSSRRLSPKSSNVRELFVSAAASASVSAASTSNLASVGISGKLSVVALANMETPTITNGRLYSSLLWVEVQKQKATLSFSTSTIIGRNSNNPKVCVNLRPTVCNHRGRVPTATVSFDPLATAWYVKDGNPFIGFYSVPGDAPLAVEPVNETYFCVDKLLPTGVDSNQTWEIKNEFVFQLYVKGIIWTSQNGSSTAADNHTNAGASSVVPFLAELVLIDRGVVQGSDCSQMIVHDQPATNHGLSVYSVMSVTIYAVAFVGAVLITRMNGITFSSPTFYNDMTSVCVVVIFLLSIVGNAIWITVSSDGQTTNASHIYYLTKILTSCFTWTMMTSVCFHWSTVLNHDVRKIRRVYLMLTFVAINGAFFAWGLFTLINMADFFKCTYDDYLKNPKYDKHMCDTDYCPDLQPLQWKYAATKLCRAVAYSNWYFAFSFATDLCMFLASLALLVLGTYVLQRGSRLIEHSGAMLDERIVTVMRNSLKTYLIVILAITLSLGVSMLLNVVLYSGDWSINAIVWYTFTVWLPTLIPPAGFLVLQWNPRLHGISWSNPSGGGGGGGGGENGDPENQQFAKNRRDAKDDELKRGLGRGNNDTFGLLSEGWTGIADFPDTDYLPIGAETSRGTQQLLTLSTQLVTPVAIAHACYMELFVGEPHEPHNGHRGGLDDFDFDGPSSTSSAANRPRGSISMMIQSGLLRESMIVAHNTTTTTTPASSCSHGGGGNASRGNSTLLGSMLVSSNNVTWTRVGFTETVLPSVVYNHNTQSQVATFMSTIQLPVLPPSSVLRFVVYELAESPVVSPNVTDAIISANPEGRRRAATDVIRPPSLHADDRSAGARVSGLGLAPHSKPRVFCEFTASITGFINADQVRLVAQECCRQATHLSAHGRTDDSRDIDIDDDDEDDEIDDRYDGEEDKLPVLRVRCTAVSTRTLKESNDFYITKCFQFADGDEMVVEDMTESIFTNEIPRQFLELLHKDRAMDLARAEHELRGFEAKCKRGLATGLYDNLIDQIQGENTQAVAQAWLEARVRRRAVYLDTIKQCQQICVDRAEEGVNFKASTAKKSLSLRFLPVNLHIQDMWVGPTSDLRSQLSRRTSPQIKLYTGVTVGAFAAHGFKFRHGVGILSMRNRLAKKMPLRSASDRLLLSRIDSGLSEKSNSDHHLDWTETAVRADEELKWQIVTRMDMCVSQALTALVASFCRNLEAALQHPSDHAFLDVIDGIGFLWQVESLLSTQGKELGMLEDFYAAVDAMKGVTFVLDVAPPPHLPPTLNLHIKDLDVPSVVSARLSGDTKSGSYTVVIGVRCKSNDVLAQIPVGVRDGGKISVTAVLFTQGINEMQTLANGSRAKKTTLQQTINHESFLLLKEYADKYKQLAFHMASCDSTTSSGFGDGGGGGVSSRMADLKLVVSLLGELEERIMSASKQMVKTKHPKIIQQSARLCRLLCAGRVTSCKSAKDRTSMSITLEQGQMLCDHHGLPAEFMARTVSTMRSNGVRLENAFKNTGKRQYAFNALQRSLLPEEYKCPEGTYGRGNMS